MDKIEMLQRLIDKSEDEKEIKDLKQQQMDAIAEREREKAEAEASKKFEEEKSAIESEKEKLQEQFDELKNSLKLGNYRDDAKIEVTETDNYKGVNLKRAKAAFADAQRKRGFTEAKERMRENPERYESMVKTFADLVLGAQQKDHTTSPESAGGYLVPDDDRTELLAYARLQSVALRDARVMGMNSDVMTMPREDAKVVLSFTDESTDMNEDDATFDQVTLTAGDLDGYADVSIHLEQDAQNPGGVVGVLLDQFIESYGQKIDSAVFAATGSPVSGLFTNTGTATVAGRSLVSDPASLTIGSLLATIGKVERPRRNGAKWYASRATIWNYLMNIQDDSKTAFAAMPQNPLDFRIVGYPLEEIEEAPDAEADGSDGGYAVFGNLNGFIIGDRLSNLTLFRDPYSKRTSKRITYSFLTRVAFATALPNNFVLVTT